MNKDTFYNYIESPEILDEKSLKDLTDLLADYPYFQAAQMLYSKNLHNINHVKYDSQLKLTSAYIYNRRKLFQLINLKPKVEINVISEVENYNEIVIENEIIPEITISEKEKVNAIDEISQISENEKLEEIDNIVTLNKIEDIVYDNVGNDTNDSNIESNIIDNNLENKEEIKIPIIEPTPVLENNTVDEPVSNNVSETEIKPAITIKPSNIADEILQRVANLKQSFDGKNNEKTESIADIILRKSALSKTKTIAENVVEPINIENEINTDATNENQISEISVINIKSDDEIIIINNDNLEAVENEQINVDAVENFENIIEIEKVTENPVIELENQIINIEDSSVTLNSEAEETISDDVPEQIEYEKVSEPEINPEIENALLFTALKNENFAFNDWFNVLKGSTIKNVEKSKSLKIITESELIEKFIKEEPKITPIKNSNLDFNVNISNDNVHESDSFITETLAKIYIKQGYYNKALNIYQKLSLKYSENNTYFAKKIEEVKNLINK